MKRYVPDEREKRMEESPFFVMWSPENNGKAIIDNPDAADLADDMYNIADIPPIKNRKNNLDSVWVRFWGKKALVKARRRAAGLSSENSESADSTESTPSS